MGWYLFTRIRFVEVGEVETGDDARPEYCRKMKIGKTNFRRKA